MPEPNDKRVAKAANLFDLRRIIGGLFIVYGVLLAVLGLFDSQEEIDKAAGVNINLWAGIGMLVAGLLFITWALTRPLADEFASDEGGGGPGGDDERSGGDPGAGPQ
jgi:drug/metabolite transporter (DMT)-like permease